MKLLQTLRKALPLPNNPIDYFKITGDIRLFYSDAARGEVSNKFFAAY